MINCIASLVKKTLFEQPTYAAAESVFSVMGNVFFFLFF